MGNTNVANAGDRTPAEPSAPADPVQELSDAAEASRKLKKEIERAQDKERAPVLRDPTRRDRQDHERIKKAV